MAFLSLTVYYVVCLMSHKHYIINACYGLTTAGAGHWMVYRVAQITNTPPDKVHFLNNVIFLYLHFLIYMGEMM